MSVKVETVACFEAGTGGLSLSDDGFLYSGDFGAILGDKDTMGKQVIRIAPDGHSETFATGLEGASGNRIGPDGALYQSNIRGSWIARIDASGQVEEYARENIGGPVGLAFDSQGRLHVANCGDQSIARVVDGKGEILARDERFKCPNGLTCDPDDNLYMVNFYDGHLFRIDPQGRVMLLADIPGGNNGHLTWLDGRLIVVARTAHQLYEVSLDGQVSVLAGSGTCGGADGAADVCEFSWPNAICYSPDGSELYINESAAPAADGKALSPTRVRRVLLK